MGISPLYLELKVTLISLRFVIEVPLRAPLPSVGSLRGIKLLSPPDASFEIIVRREYSRPVPVKLVSIEEPRCFLH